MPATYLQDDEDLADEEEQDPPPALRPKRPPPVTDDDDYAGPETPATARQAPMAPSADPVYARLQELAGERPVRPKPKWWQQLGAAGFGAAAGWSNAAGRTKHPIDIESVNDNILAPGYKEDVKRFESEVAPVEAQAQVSGQRAKANQAEATAEYRRAGASAAADRGAYWRSKSKAEQLQWTSRKDGSLYNKITGETKAPASTPEQRYKQAIDIGGSEDQARAYALTQRWVPAPAASNRPVSVAAGAIAVDPQTGKVIARNPKAPKEVDPELEENRRASREMRENADLDRVSSTKEANERTIHTQREKEIAATVTRLGAQSAEQLPPEVMTAINQRYARQLQTVQDNFANSIRRRGKPAEDWDVDPDTLEYRQRGQGQLPGAARPVTAPAIRKPQGPAGQQGAPAQQYSEQEVRAAAKAKGLNPQQEENAVVIARQRGQLR